MKNEVFNGRYISGKGDAEYLKLIESSFAMLNDSAELPALRMLYKSETDMLSEGFIWGSGWWIQNSYGFALGASPFLSDLLFAKMQNSYDAFWRRMGDGKRIGADSGEAEPDSIFSLCAPEGSLGDCVFCEGIIYKQGDGDWASYDWFYEAAAAGVCIQADMLLFDRRDEAIGKYLPLMRKTLDFIEKTRAENNLFLVGASANLLAPSYGGSFDSKTGEIGKGYLTGLSVNYSVALRKTAQLLRMTGDVDGAREYERRYELNLSALPLLLTDEGYFVKSMDTDGTKHGVFGADRYGYLEAVCNVDAVAGGVVSPENARSIYKKLASVPQLRPAGIICTNYPHLDDTLESYKKGTREPHSLGWLSGDWVDGGCWCTVEGRAVLAYMKLGKYADAFRSCKYYMDWAEEYRQDAPMSQWGVNSNNPWQKENDEHTECERPVAIMIDNFATVTCLLRGLFGYRATAGGLYLSVQMPDSITEYSQKLPVRFGGCALYISYNKAEKLSASVDGVVLECTENEIFIPSALLKNGTAVAISINGAEPADICAISSAREEEIRSLTAKIPEELDEELTAVYRDCINRFETETDYLQRQMLIEILSACHSLLSRQKLPFDKHTLRPMTEEKQKTVIDAYRTTVLELYRGVIGNTAE